MKIPLINSDPDIHAAIEKSVRKVNRGEKRHINAEAISSRFDLVPIADQEDAIEFINYLMPPLLMLNFTDPKFDGFEVVKQIAEDPWLNHGGIIGLFSDYAAFDRLNDLRNVNLVVTINQEDVGKMMEPVLNIIKEHQHFLFQRAIHTDLLASISGHFELGMDLMLVPCYANLITNYLFNVGFLGVESKLSVSLVLTEMLTNAIEHGSCAITYEEKSKWLEKNGTIQGLIKKKGRNKSIAGKKVHFSYQIDRGRSIYTIRDEGAGFDWRARLEHLEKADPLDLLSEHGRGIMLTQQTVNSLTYNDVGNEVTFTIDHTKDSGVIPEALRNNEVVEFKPGDVVFRQGEESDFLYYVADGEYTVMVNQNHVANLSTDDILMGEMSFLLEETRSATVIASSHGRLLKITKENFINILKNQPYYGLFLSKLIAKRLHRLSRGILS